VSGTRLTVGATPVCTGKGRYQWKLVGKTLTHKKVADTCPGRAVVFAGVWTKKA